jgi:hypothetical protein
MRIVELIIDEKDETSGIDAVSVVESPAIESDFIALKKHEIELKEVDAEKRILMGAALIPNKQIYRKNDKNEEYYIYFSEETVRKASELFFMNSNQNNATLEHKQKLEGMSVVESWIVEGSHDKSMNYGFNFPKGTWVISMKVNNDEIWNKVKLGEVKGFSIEGYFADKYEMSLNNIDMEEIEMVEKIKSLIEKSELKTNKVELNLVDDLKVSIGKVSSLNASVNAMSSNAEKTNKLFINALAQKEIILKNYNDNRKISENLNKELNLLFKTINTQAKDLGININELTVYKDFLKAKDDLRLSSDKTQSSWNLISKY